MMADKACHKGYWLLIVILFAVTSCGLPMRTPEPYVGVPIGWKTPIPAPAKPCDQFVCWWDVFCDPVLDMLEQQALANSQTLEQALWHVCEARANAVSSCSSLWPQVSLQPSFFNQDSLLANPIPSFPPGLGFSIPRQFRYHNVQYTMPLVIGYEVDLWRKYSHMCDAGCQRAQAAQEDWYATQLMLTTDVAQAYFILRTLDSDTKLLRNTVEVRQKNLDLNNSRYQEGLATYLDVSGAELLLYQAQAELEEFVRERAVQENTLALLCGVPAPQFEIEFAPLEGYPPIISPDLPSDVLCRRPDIAEAERNMEALYHDMGVEYASLFPSLSLSGTIGYESPTLSNWFSWQARLWSLTVDAAQTLFDAGRNQANVCAAKARYKEQIAVYKQQILTAFQEVETSLSNTRQHWRALEALDKQAQAARITDSLTRDRYLNGLVNYLDVMLAEIALLEAERAALDTRGETFTDVVQLIKALGGAW